MAKIKVISPGLFTTVQDLGRCNHRSFGVPVSGVMDVSSANLGNTLLNNNQSSAVLEITAVGPKLEFLDPAVIILTGADLSAQIDGQPIKPGEVLKISKNQLLSFGKAKYGSRAYLAIKCGFDADEQLGSRSSYDPASLGQRRIKKDDILKFWDHNGSNLNRRSRVKQDPQHFSQNEINVYPGPEFDLIHSSFLEQEFILSNDCSRMGFRLNCNDECAHNKSILTSAVMPGTVQLPPSGEPIVLMRDSQTTGGYPRILQLEEHSINVLAQKNPGDNIRFKLLKY